MKKITCILLPFPYEIFKVTPLLAGLQHKQPFHPSGFTQESPVRFQRTWTKKLEPCHLKPGTHDHKKKLNKYGVSLLVANPISPAPMTK